MTIRNTAKDEVNPGWLMGGNPSAIEAQEARGQQQLAADSALPTQGLAEIAGELGIAVIGQRNGDPLFSDVTLPDGWKIVPTGHSMWSDLIDADGKKRAAIFYKAAFYDRNAFICKA